MRYKVKMEQRKLKLHLVQLNDGILNDWRYADNKPEILYANIKNHRFEGYLENISCSALYFKPKDSDGSDSLIIIPHSWVKWCVPVEESEEVE